MAEEKIKPESRGWRRADFDLAVNELAHVGAIIEPEPRDIGAFSYRLQFQFEGGAIVSVAISLKEWQSTSDVVITTMTTRPPAERRKGHGSRVVSILVEWAKKHGWNEILASQVSSIEAIAFWQDNRFVCCPDSNPTGDYVRKII